jgi:NADH-quinone oxidoreductase subunit E
MTQLPPYIYNEIDIAIKKYPEGQARSAIKTALTLAQEFNGGWLTTDLMKEIADYLKIPQIAVYEVATFYSLYELEPVGKHKIALCTNVSCYLRGADHIRECLEKKLGIQLGETTPDGKITLREVECVAACAEAPVLQVNGEYLGHLTEDAINHLLKSLE